MDQLRLHIMVNKQLQNIEESKKLKEKDMKRIILYTNGCIFNNSNCVLWNGYITDNKKKYINFYLNGRKLALHRILYINYIGQLYDNQYLDYTCELKSECCNINHIVIKKNKIKKNKIKKNIIDFNI